MKKLYGKLFIALFMASIVFSGCHTDSPETPENGTESSDTGNSSEKTENTPSDNNSSNSSSSNNSSTSNSSSSNSTSDNSTSSNSTSNSSSSSSSSTSNSVSDNSSSNSSSTTSSTIDNSSTNNGTSETTTTTTPSTDKDNVNNTEASETEDKQEENQNTSTDSNNQTNTDNNSQESTDSTQTENTTDYDQKIIGSEISWAVWTKDISANDGKQVKITFSGKIKLENSENSSYSKNLMIQLADSNKAYPIIASGTVSNNWTEISGNKTLTLGNNSTIYISTYNISDDLEKLNIYVKDINVTVEEISSSSENNNSSSETNNNNNSNNDFFTEGAHNWLSDQVPSLYDTYKDQFDYIGIAAEYGNFGLSQSGSNKYTATYTKGNWGTPNELYYTEVQNGIKKHANSITLGNELKPQFLLQWWSGDATKNTDGTSSGNTFVKFTGSNGKEIDVPSSLNGEKLIYATLNAAKAAGVQMRGHVLTWHSQTPDGFFAEGYSPEYNGDSITNLVTKDEMTARHEWYIKTVLECVANWESANGYGTGNHIIWAWDVVNEAMADDAGKTYTGDSQDWLRGSTTGTKDKSPTDYPQGSRWYQIYGNEEFIINAFRFANAYAPSDVKLCYNDYNEYIDYSAGWKTSAICHIAELIKNGEAKTVNSVSINPRLDVIAMQSHVGISYPDITAYESALKRFLAIADVHISEIDFSAETQASAATAYKNYFTMLQKYGKNYSGTHKITNVTIWGINNENSWINPSSSGGKKTYPLLFNIDDKVTTTTKEVTYDTGTENQPRYDIGDSYLTNDSFWAVINAHK